MGPSINQRTNNRLRWTDQWTDKGRAIAVRLDQVGRHLYRVNQHGPNNSRESRCSFPQMSRKWLGIGLQLNIGGPLPVSSRSHLSQRQRPAIFRRVSATIRSIDNLKWPQFDFDFDFDFDFFPHVFLSFLFQKFGWQWSISSCIYPLLFLSVIIGFHLSFSLSVSSCIWFFFPSDFICAPMRHLAAITRNEPTSMLIK